MARLMGRRLPLLAVVAVCLLVFLWVVSSKYPEPGTLQPSTFRLSKEPSKVPELGAPKSPLAGLSKEPSKVSELGAQQAPLSGLSREPSKVLELGAPKSPLAGLSKESSKIPELGAPQAVTSGLSKRPLEVQTSSNASTQLTGSPAPDVQKPPAQPESGPPSSANQGIADKPADTAGKDATLTKPRSESEIREDLRTYTEGLPPSREVTVVTAYFNLGSLQKTAGREGRYTPSLYTKWMGSFAYLDNPLIVFVDSASTEERFRSMRARLPSNRTTIFRLQRNDLWAFKLEAEIKAVYAQHGYPHHAPNTINPLYSCAMHAKFELVQRVVREQLHQTPYVAWLDIGLFRGEALKTERIHLKAPATLNDSKVAYSGVNPFKQMAPLEVVKSNSVWVGGATFLGRAHVLDLFCSEYRQAVRKLLEMKIMSTDQQVIYIMFQPSFDFKPKTEIQIYTTKSGWDWFYLGYVMKKEP